MIQFDPFAAGKEGTGRANKSGAFYTIPGATHRKSGPNLGPKSASVGALAGAEIYKALGASENISYISDIMDGGHCGWRAEFNAPLTAAILKHLLKTGTTAGKIAIRSGVTAPLADWRDWETPTLQ